MACMEHFCINPKCGWGEFDNDTHKKCPKCGAPVRSFFDEQADHDREAYERKHGPIDDGEENDDDDNT